MVEPFLSTPVLADVAESPLGGGHYQAGEFGNLTRGAQVTLSERFPLAICDVCAWTGNETNTANAIKRATGLALTGTKDAVSESAQAFQHAPARWTVISADQTLPHALTGAVGDNGTVVDLSHGRTVLRVHGAKSRWVLAKLFALDFQPDTFPLEKGVTTAHHDIFAQIQIALSRTATDGQFGFRNATYRIDGAAKNSSNVRDIEDVLIE